MSLKRRVEDLERISGKGPVRTVSVIMWSDEKSIEEVYEGCPNLRRENEARAKAGLPPYIRIEADPENPGEYRTIVTIITTDDDRPSATVQMWEDEEPDQPEGGAE